MNKTESERVPLIRISDTSGLPMQKDQKDPILADSTDNLHKSETKKLQF